MKIGFSLLLFVFLLTGCVQKEILDDVQLASAVGYDLIDEKNIETTAVVPVYLPDKSVEQDTYKAIAPLSKEARATMSGQSPKPFVSGKLEVGVYNQELAEYGILNITDTFVRDPSVGSKMFLIVAEESAKELLEKQYGQLDTGMHLSKLIQQNVDGGMLPATNLHLFMWAYYDEGIDPILPLVESLEDKANIKGIAIFKDDKMVSQINDKDDLFVYQVLLEKFSTKNSISVDLEKEGEYASVYNIQSSRKYVVRNPMSAPEINIKIKIKSILREYTGKSLTQKKIKEIESLMEKVVTKKGLKLIKEFQELGVDPVGIGKEVKKSTRSWNKKKWEDLYPTAKITIQAEVKITEHGVVE